MDKKTKKDWLDLFLEAYRIIIKPDLDKLVIKEELSEFKDGVYNKMDTVYQQAVSAAESFAYKEVLDMRTEQSAISGRFDKNEETLEDHGKRIKKLESSPAIAHKVKK